MFKILITYDFCIDQMITGFFTVHIERKVKLKKQTDNSGMIYLQTLRWEVMQVSIWKN